jgi:hypothetical protein
VRSVDGSNWHVKKVRENARWQVSIRITLVWDNVSHENIGLVATIIYYLNMNLRTKGSQMN